MTILHVMTVVGLGMMLCTFAGDQDKKEEPYKPKPGETVVKMTIEGKGDLYMQMYVKEAPKTCDNFLKLVKEKFYDGIRFHRVVPSFVAQAGDPQSKTLPMGDPKLGNGGPGYTIKFEPNPMKHEKGALGMARTPDPDSAGSQFYICLEPQARLDGQYVVFGKVVQGFEIVQQIRQGDKIVEARIIQDAREKK
jgi:cyclophilin family peptidyl-prolyl cis-trans isomerase